MVAVIPERLRASLRDYVIAVGTRDAHLMVQAYIDSGVLLPGAYRKRIEELHETLFARLGGVPIGKLSDIAMQQAQAVITEYRDIVYEMPFQFPTDMLFAVRAVAILSGMATSLDASFDPWAATLPFAERMAGEQLSRDWRGWVDDLSNLARLALRLPGRMERFLTQAERGELVTTYSLAPDATRSLRRIERAVDRLTWGVIAAGLLVAGIVLRDNGGCWRAEHGPAGRRGAGFPVGADATIGRWLKPSSGTRSALKRTAAAPLCPCDPCCASTP